MKFLQRGGTWVIAQFLLLILWGLSILYLPGHGYVGWRWIGFVLTLAGCVCLLLSFLSHGSHLTPLPAPNMKLGLKTTGIYALVRHPMYLGVMLLVFGISLWASGVWALLMCVVLACFFNLKARAEERFLLGVYPEYEAYQNRTGRFLPRLQIGNARRRK